MLKHPFSLAPLTLYVYFYTKFMENLHDFSKIPKNLRKYVHIRWRGLMKGGGQYGTPGLKRQMPVWKSYTDSLTVE